MISGIADQVDSTKVHVSVGVNGPLVPASDRSVPVGGVRKGHATEPVDTPSQMALDGSGPAALNRISITRITIPDRHHLQDGLCLSGRRDIGLGGHSGGLSTSSGSSSPVPVRWGQVIDWASRLTATAS